MDGGAPEARRGIEARSASTKCISARGGASPRRGIAILSYLEFAETLLPYVLEMGFTHIELMPIAEHPFEGSWGYQVTNYYAPTSRFGNAGRVPAFRRRVSSARASGVIMDWVPAHFPKDAHGLAEFDGTRSLRARRPAAGRAPGLGDADFQLRAQRGPQFPHRERALLARPVSHRRSARGCGGFDALPRLLAPSRGSGSRTAFGGRENLEAIYFLKRLNEAVLREFSRRR